MNKDVTALEIGSGGGRWTQYLKDCQRLYLVELNPAMFSYIIDRFDNADNFYYVTTHGADFPLVPKQSIDFVFSFGVLVHLDYEIIEDYVKNLIPLLKPGAHISFQFSVFLLFKGSVCYLKVRLQNGNDGKEISRF